MTIALIIIATWLALYVGIIIGGYRWRGTRREPSNVIDLASYRRGRAA